VEKSLKATLPIAGFVDVPPTRSRIMSAIRGKHNQSTELRFRMALVRSQLRGWITHPALPGKPDFYFPTVKLVIFLDGCFWHGCKYCGHIPKTNSAFWRMKIVGNQTRDRRNNRKLRTNGFTVLRFWEHSLQNQNDLRNILLKVKNILDR
jgi:DNA mismatch endonuclease, patch repair protein